MAYKKKTWKNRQSEHPNRRKLSPADESNVYDVQRMEGLVMEEGDAFDQNTMNDLENRVAEAFREDGVNLYTHKRTGTQHTLTGTGNNIRFAATADFAAGDTFLVNGTVCAAKTAAGDALWSGFFKSGAVVVCWRSGNNLTFNAGGLPGPQAAKLTPENIKSGVSVEVNGKTVTGTFTQDANAQSGDIAPGKTAYAKGNKITGNFTSDANATSNDIRAGKTAYVNGVKVTGVLASRDTGTPNWCEFVRVYNGRFEIAPPAGIHGCYWDGGQYSYLTFDQVRNAIGLTADKLVLGNTILGITGTFRDSAAFFVARKYQNNIMWSNNSRFSIDARCARCLVDGQYTIRVVCGTRGDNTSRTFVHLRVNGSDIYSQESSSWWMDRTVSVWLSRGAEVSIYIDGSGADATATCQIMM